jgi:phosphoribosylaminoimidazole (AIR) synthetase
MGIGMTFVVSPYYAETIQQRLASAGFESWPMGRVTEGDQSVQWSDQTARNGAARGT